MSTLFDLRYMDDFVIMAPSRHRLRRAIKEVHAVMARLGLCLHATKRCIGKLSNGYKSVPTSQTAISPVASKRRGGALAAARRRLRSYQRQEGRVEVRA